MSLTRKSLIGGIVGAIIAISLIVAGAYAFAGSSNGSFFGLGGSSSGSGTMQLSMIDPPNVPGNVVAVYVNYSSIQVHEANAGNQSGWHNVTSSGTIDLMKIVSSSQVLGSANLPSGTYNIVRFNISSAVVTVNSTSGTLQNYTASVPSGMVQSVITGGINVKGGATSALLVDISPKVTYGGNQYTLVPSATAAPSTPLPSSSVPTTTVTSVSTRSHTT
jgi:hypothetical protein